ncbi:MAG: 3-isopropylmalate dehydratase large subunit [Methanolobus sp.]|nr:3-isopropylmalate dehydratase large subunit [Methanolobus sp.]
MSTISEKILSRASGKKAHANDFVIADIDFAMAHDGTSVLAVRAFREMEQEIVWNPERIVIPFDHLTPANTDTTAALQQDIREWIKDQKIKNFYDIGEGICHQLLPENGFALPGKLIVGADSHSCTYGAFGAFGTGVGATDMAEIFASGKLWLKVPESIMINAEGKFNKGVYAKDLTLKIIGTLGVAGATYKAAEFYGSTIDSMSMSGRMTLSNMAIEMGAKAGIVPPDSTTLDFLERIAVEEYEAIYADDNAIYSEEYNFDTNELEPQIACPHQVDNVRDISDVKPIKLDQAFIGTCTNGRLEDLEVAATILKGEKVVIRTIVVPASRTVLLEAVRKGFVEDLLGAGVTIGPPGCGPCLGGHMGVIGKGEACISTANRNFKGRMGVGGFIYLASPATAAASALTGEITDPRDI